MSRCGSTLAAQVLSALPQHVVISEAPVLDTLLRGGDPADTDERVAWIRWVVSALGQKRAGRETRCFIKLDCWHVPYLPLLRKAMPDVPWIFLYRDPVEVMASHEAAPALWRVPGMLDPQTIGMDLPSALHLDPLEYCARILQKICEGAVSFGTDPLGRLVNYSELPDAVWTTVASHFGLTFSSADIAAMKEKAQFNAKTPQILFESDGKQKRDRASDRAAAIAERWLTPVYRRLEQARTEQIYPAAAGAVTGF